MRELEAVDSYDLILALLGLAALGTALIPRLIHDHPVSFPILYVGLGIVIFALPLGLPDPDPLIHRDVAERLTELGVIVALMGAGLKLDRPVGWARWRSTWQLLAVTFPLTIVLSALLGYWAVGLAPAAAMLLGAVISPTDPVLASDVQVQGPGRGEEDEVRFALTSEAGLNDGLAFPFTNAAIAMAVSGASPQNWIGEWLLVDIAYRVAVGIVLGYAIGRGLAGVVFALPARTRLAEFSEGLVALAATLIAYGLTELAGGYGFLAVFVAAVALRDYEREHEYHKVLHQFSEEVERLLMAVLLILLGGAIVTGLFEHLTWEAALAGAIIVIVIRPVSGIIALGGVDATTRQKITISFFGIRGIGSLYYLAHAINQAFYGQETRLWALVGFIVLLSIVLHGATATPVMRTLEEAR